MQKDFDKKEIRCGYCNRLLGKGTAHDLSIKCPRCGCLNHVRDTIPGPETHGVPQGQSFGTVSH